jgi:hypothetical protein
VLGARLALASYDVSLVRTTRGAAARVRHGRRSHAMASKRRRLLMGLGNAAQIWQSLAVRGLTHRGEPAARGQDHAGRGACTREPPRYTRRPPDPLNEERDMLVPPPARITPRRSVREWLQIVDAYTLWAFNAGRPTER